MNKVKNILYLGWLGKGNVGDDVLYELFKSMFYKYHEPVEDGYSVNIDSYPLIDKYIVDISKYNLVVLGGGSLLHIPLYLNICSNAIQKGIPVISWGTGIDGNYKPEMLNFTNINHLSEFKEIYNKFSLLSVRGPFTKRMLTDLGLKVEIHEIGDPALAYYYETFGEELPVSPPNKTIIVNWGTSYNNIFGKNEFEVEQELVEVIKVLIKKGYNITIYPIWTEDIESVIRLGNKVNNPSCRVINEVFEANVLQRIISKGYLSINFKLHSNILSAAANRPFISMAYRGKCFDFAETVNCQEFAVSTELITAEKLIDMVEDIEENYLEIVGRIKRAKEKYYPELVHTIKKVTQILDEQISLKSY